MGASKLIKFLKLLFLHIISGLLYVLHGRKMKEKSEENLDSRIDGKED